MTTVLRSITALTLVAVCLAPLRAQDAPAIQPDVVYGHKDGMALTFDLFRPAKPNGAAILSVQSGGWYSNWVDPKLMLPAVQPVLAKGYTVFVVRHGSAPKYAIPDVVADMRRSVRYIRLHAKEFGVDPERLGVMGGSAGGHLTLMLATAADEGDPKAKDEVLRQSDRIAAAVALYPPTDIRTWITDPPPAIKKIDALKPPLTFDAEKGGDYSPLLHVSEKTAPTLLIHGDKDELVPIEHSNTMFAALQKAKVPSDLLVIEGAGHGFRDRQVQTVSAATLAWFDKYLTAKKDRQ
jgi:acetyl esterase/lipase